MDGLMGSEHGLVREHGFGGVIHEWHGCGEVSGIGIKK